MRLVAASASRPHRQEPALVPLARVQAASFSGDALLAVALAGTLLFSVSIHAARPKVLAYLVLTMVPFAVVAPVVGPLVDRFRRARPMVVALTCASRAVLCLLMARDLRSLLLYPEAFGALLAQKGYSIASKSLVPALLAEPGRLVGANARLVRIGLAAGAVALPVGAGMSKVAGAAWTLRVAGLVYVAGAVMMTTRPGRLRHQVTIPAERPDLAGADPTRPDLAGADPTLPDLAGADPTLPDLAGADPTRPDLAGADPTRPDLAGADPTRPDLAGADPTRPDRRGNALAAHLRGRPPDRRAPLARAASAMGLLRGAVGFLAFLVVFALKRANAPSWEYGLVIVAAGLGSFVGAVVAPALRRRVSERAILLASLLLPAAMSLADLGYLGRSGVAGVTFVLGVAASAGRVAFDSLVQTDAPEVARGTAFARFETRFQLTWVVAGLVPVALQLGLGLGMGVLGVALGVAAGVYGASLRIGPAPSPARHRAT